MRRVTPFVAALGFLLLGACGEDDDGGPSLTKEQYADLGTRTWCAWIFSCCDSSEQQFYTSGQGFSNESGCISAGLKESKEVFSLIPNSNWSPEGAGACMEIYKEMQSCPRISAVDLKLKDDCWPYVAGKKEGDPCKEDYECSTHLCQSKVCVALKPAGSICNYDEDCQKGMICNFSGKCQPLLNDGASCTSAGDCLSMSCVAGKCETTTSYFCDGK